MRVHRITLTIRKTVCYQTKHSWMTAYTHERDIKQPSVNKQQRNIPDRRAWCRRTRRTTAPDGAARKGKTYRKKNNMRSITVDVQFGAESKCNGNADTTVVSEEGRNKRSALQYAAVGNSGLRDAQNITKNNIPAGLRCVSADPRSGSG